MAKATTGEDAVRWALAVRRPVAPSGYCKLADLVSGPSLSGLLLETLWRALLRGRGFAVSVATRQSYLEQLSARREGVPHHPNSTPNHIGRHNHAWWPQEPPSDLQETLAERTQRSCRPCRSMTPLREPRTGRRQAGYRRWREPWKDPVEVRSRATLLEILPLGGGRTRRRGRRQSGPCMTEAAAGRWTWHVLPRCPLLSSNHSEPV